MAPEAVSRPTYWRGLWYRWKALRLPWRRRWLVGHDLAGNTFWEFQNQLNPGRPRRIAQYPSSTHYGDVKLSPAWLQWLRHTRPEAPSIEEQQYDVLRQDNLRQLAAQADARWAEKESYLDSPKETGQPRPLMESRDPGGYAPRGEHASQDNIGSMDGDTGKARPKGDASQSASPWAKWEAQKKGAPSDGWQPESWTPGKVDSR